MGYWTKHVFIGLIILICSGVSIGQSDGQYSPFNNFFTPPDTLNKKRFNLALTSSSLIYTGFSIGLYNTWYKQYPQSKFHVFNDWNEWNNIDKAGHLYTAYFQGVLTYKGARWTGLSEDNSILVGAICGTLFQSTIEVMDGFSDNWGFSIGDMAANVAGVGAFVVQQKAWGEQRINLKVSSWPKRYSDQDIFSVSGESVTNLEQRAAELYGSGYAESFLKDYNAQTIWASFNLRSFMHEDSAIPNWLNVAVGYGSENMFGGFENEWLLENDDRVVLDTNVYPRHKQYYLGLDIDLTRIKVKSPFLRSLLSILNIFKLPMPAIEYNSLGKFRVHALSK